MFFGNAHINKLLARLFAAGWIKANPRRNSRMNHDNLRVALDFCHEVEPENFAVAFATAPVDFASFDIERSRPMPAFAVLFGIGIATAFLRMQMHHDRARRIFHGLENFNERSDIITLFKILVIKAKRLEVIVFRLARSRAKFCQRLVKPAVVFGNGHFVIVHHNDKIRRIFARIIKTFKRFATAQGTVTNHRNHIARFTQHIASGRKAKRKAYRRRGMPHHKEIVFTFSRFAIARHIAVMRFVQERLGTAREHLVAVALVAHVIDNLVLWRIENVVERNRPFDKAEVRRHVTATLRKLFKECCAHFGGKLFETLDVQRFNVGRGLDFF